MILQEFLNRYDYDPQKDCIGEGGFGSVYKAYDNVLDREVAIKISAVRNISGKTFSLKTECETALSLPPHPNIAQYESVYSFQLPTGTSDFAVIQYYPEGSLKSLITSRPLSSIQKEELLWALLDGLEHLHKHNIIHRDLKPANILIAKRMREGSCIYIPKIADFGLSKVIEGEHSHVSSSFAGGTLEYSSPEQLKGQSLYYNSDLWSWAVIAYEVLTGNKLFQAPNNSSAFAVGGVVDLIFGEDLSSKLALLDEPWHSFVVACLERDPDQRVRDVLSLKQLLISEEEPKSSLITSTQSLSVQDDTESIKWRQHTLSQSDADAQYNLGNMYYDGYGVEQDYTEAVKWYRKAAEQGDADAQYNLGHMYYKGYGVEQDYTEAVKWYRKAAEQGYADAQNNLGNMYYDGDGVEQDYTEAVKWYRKAAEQGYVRIQNYLGDMYYYGRGVNRDYTEAVKWYRKAAEQEDADAQNNLGYMYRQGYGVSQDDTEALKWYRKAAEQGHASAQRWLRWMAMIAVE